MVTWQDYGRPAKGNSVDNGRKDNAFALTARRDNNPLHPGCRYALPWAMSRLPFAFPFSRRPLVQRDKRKSWVKWQPAFRLVKVVFVVVNRQHRVQNQTVVPVVSVVV